MAAQSTSKRPDPGATPAAASGRAPLGATLALVMALATAAFGIVMPLVMHVVPGTTLPAPFPEQHQHGETLTYLGFYVVLVPLAVLVGRRVADRVARGPNAVLLGPLAAVLVALLAAGVFAVRAAGRVVGHDGVLTVLAASVVWWALAAPLLARAAAARPWPRAAALVRAGPPRALWGLAAVVVLAALACFAHRDSISLPVLVAGALVAVALVAAVDRAGARRVPRAAAVAVDVVAVAALLLAVPDLVVFRPEEARTSLAAALETGIIQFHHDFLLGPANEVLHGRPILGGTASQYGVLSIDFLAGWFKLAPIGYGTLAFLTGALTALWFAAGYGIARLAGTPRGVAVGALAVAVVVLAYNLPYPVGALPQSGPLRFGLPMVLVLCAVAAERWPGRRGAWRAATAGALGVASVWAFESLAFSAVVFAALACVLAWLAGTTARARLRALVRLAAEGAAGCVAAHVLFALALLAATGRLRTGASTSPTCASS